MNKALQQIFWGYVFIWIDIYIIIDLFMDPIGYLLLFSGCSKLVVAYPIAKKAKLAGLIGAFVSLPSVFVNFSGPNLSIGWSSYVSLLLVLNTIVGYYLFLVLKIAANVFGSWALQRRTDSTFKFYIAIHLISLAFFSFSMNMPGYGDVTLSVISAICLLLMDILFLFLVRAIRRVCPKQLRINTLI